MPPPAPDIELSLLAPAHNEEDNITRLVAEAGDSLEAAVGGGVDGGRYEFVIVDDGSTDQTRERVNRLMPSRP
ncbi:MAG TPA: glycosyltransferase, partial [Phycisphaerales bacterium]|nr:glycosyltransferase [Phycisphaerales bacterium]